MHKIEGLLDYDVVLQAAGYEVVAYTTFGSYQGDWWAKVKTPAGEKGWIHGYYGSCSGCDNLQATFDYGVGTYEDGHTWFTDEEWTRIKEFGEGEASEFYTQEDAVAEASKHLEWDMEAKEVVDWLQKNAW